MHKVNSILFNSKLVQAVQNRNLSLFFQPIKPQPEGKVFHCTGYEVDHWAEEVLTEAGISHREIKRPYCPGDILYVREAWTKTDHGYLYAADYDKHDAVPIGGHVYWSKNMIKWQPSVHMPKEAVRIFLKIKSIKAQRLQDFLCCRSEIVKAGIQFDSYSDSKQQFMEFWDSAISTNNLSVFGFDANPWVWAIEFERCEKPEGF